MATLSGGRLESAGQGPRIAAPGQAVVGVVALNSSRVAVKVAFWGGADYIAGTVTINDTPRQALVRVHEQASGSLVFGAWTQPDGSFRIEGASYDHRYSVTAFDPVTGEQAVIYDRV